MITFKQKEFVAPLIGLAGLAMPAGEALMGTAMIAGTGISAVQGKKSNKIAEEQGEEQARIQRKMQQDQQEFQQKQLEIQRDAIAKGISPVAEIKSYSVNFAAMKNAGSSLLKSVKNSGFLKNAKDSAKGIWEVSHQGGRNLTKTLVHGTVMGGSIAGVGYVANKLIEKDQKKNAQQATPNPEEKTYALSPGALKAGTKKIGGYVKSALKDNLAPVVKNPTTGKLKVNSGALMTYGFGAALPAIGYISQKNQAKNQAAATVPEEKAYALPAGFMTKVGKGVKGFVKAPITKAGNGISSFLGAGIKKSQGFANDLAKYGKEHGNAWLEKGGTWVGDALKTNEKGRLSLKGKAVLGGATVIGSTVMFKPWELGEKATKKAIGAVDKNAYAYEKSQEQAVN